MSEDIRDFGANDEPQPWLLCRADVEALESILQEILSWRSQIRNGRDLLALGAAVTSIESILEKGYSGCGVQIGWTLRPDSMEGVSADLAISDDGIALGRTEFVPTGQGNSCDHACETLAFLNEDGGFKVAAIDRWLELVEHVKGDVAKFESEITWLQEY